MTQITAYAYNADYHCIKCTKKLFKGFKGEQDEHGVCCTVPVVFSTDELPTQLGDTFGDEMHWYEPVEYHSCGTCRKEFSLLTGEMKWF